MSNRQMRFKNKGAYDAQELRRRREEEGIQLRKQKWEENLAKKRVMHSADDDLMSNEEEIKIPVLNKIYSDNVEEQLEATQQYRRLLSQEPNPPIEQVINLGIVPRFIQFLDQEDNSILQFEAAWALTNIASGTTEQTRVVINAGGIIRFVKLLNSLNPDVKEQSVWALGNIAGDSPDCRDLVLNTNCLPTILGILMDPNTRLSMLRNSTWALSNLCRGKDPAPSPDKVNPCLPVLTKLMTNDDGDVVTDACWALSYLSDGMNERIQPLVDCPGLVGTLVQILANNKPSVVSAALRAVGNIVTGDDSQTQAVIDHNALPLLKELLNHPKEAIKKEACWTISNITAGTKPQIQAVIDAQIIPVLIDLLPKAEFKTKKEAAWAITNATTGGTPEQIKYIVDQGAISQLCNLLSLMDSKMIQVALNGLENILALGEKEYVMNGQQNPFAFKVEECDGLDKIEMLQSHENINIYKKALSIIEKYFSSEEDELEGYVQQQSGDQGGGGFNFNVDMNHQASFNPALFGDPSATHNLPPSLAGTNQQQQPSQLLSRGNTLNEQQTPFQF